MQTIIVTGNIGKDAETRSTQSGDQVTSFNVGSQQGYGDKKSTNWFRVSVWGKRGATIAQYLLKGVKVTVCGELEIGEYDGKPQYNIRANEIDFGKREGGERQSEKQSEPAKAQGGGGYEPESLADLDDDVPFITCQRPFDRRLEAVL